MTPFQNKIVEKLVSPNIQHQPLLEPYALSRWGETTFSRVGTDDFNCDFDKPNLTCTYFAEDKKTAFADRNESCQYLCLVTAP